MASRSEEGIPDQQEDVLLSDPGLFPQDAWMLEYDLGLGNPAPDALMYLEDQPLGSAGEYCPPAYYPTQFCSPSNVTDISHISGTFTAQSPDYHTNFYNTPSTDLGPPLGLYPTQAYLSSPEQPCPDLPSASEGRPGRLRTDLPADKPRSMLIIDSDEDGDHDHDDHDGDDNGGVPQAEANAERLRRNRVAATNCRRRKKRSDADLEARERKLHATNDRLKENVASLRDQILDLKNEIFKHGRCESEHITNYIEREAAKFR